MIKQQITNHEIFNLPDVDHYECEIEDFSIEYLFQFTPATKSAGGRINVIGTIEYTFSHWEEKTMLDPIRGEEWEIGEGHYKNDTVKADIHLIDFDVVEVFRNMKNFEIKVEGDYQTGTYNLRFIEV